jgi:hypothetical protein
VTKSLQPARQLIFFVRPPEAEGSMRRARGEILAIFWGRTYATWAALKLMYEMLPWLCIRHPIANFAMLAALWELVIGVGICKRNTRRMAAIAGTVTNLGLLAFAFIADAWQLPWEGCGCVFIRRSTDAAVPCRRLLGTASAVQQRQAEPVNVLPCQYPAPRNSEDS